LAAAFGPEDVTGKDEDGKTEEHKAPHDEYLPIQPATMDIMDRSLHRFRYAKSNARKIERSEISIWSAESRRIEWEQTETTNKEQTLALGI